MSTSQAATDSLPPSSWSQYFWVWWIIAQLPFRIPIGLFVHNKGRSWTRAAQIATLRFAFRDEHRWDIPSMMVLFGKTSTQAYEAWARASGIEVRTDLLAEGAKLHWVGPRRTDRVLMYLHGGGFSIPARDYLFTMVQSLQTALKQTHGDIGVAFLEYSLAPGAPLPTQLRQANAFLTHILDTGTDPANIVLAGDAAGANLILQVCSHILHPLASIPPPPKLSGPLGGALMISPWTTYNVSTLPSYTYNAKEDVWPPKAYDFLAAQLLPGVTPELRSYVEPLSADAKTWWIGLDSVLPRVLVLAGEKEVILDGVLQTAEVLKAHIKDVEVVIQPNAVHEDIVMAFAAGTEEGRNNSDFKTSVRFMSEIF